jgi:hypothetical protein
MFKLCCRCGITKPVGEFHRDAQKSDGLTTHCKTCRNEMNRAQYEQHQTQILKHGQQFYRRNKERIFARRRELYRAKVGG